MSASCPARPDDTYRSTPRFRWEGVAPRIVICTPCRGGLAPEHVSTDLLDTYPHSDC